VCCVLQGNQPFIDIGEEYLPTTPILMFRLIPAVAGSLIVPIVFLIARRLRLSLLFTVLCTSMVLSFLTRVCTHTSPIATRRFCSITCFSAKVEKFSRTRA
jgi:dolichyl-phosphate-mannose--protein O-mannosyl transferase